MNYQNPVIPQFQLRRRGCASFLTIKTRTLDPKPGKGVKIYSLSFI